MNNIRVLLNAVKGINIKVNITINNGINYICFVYDINDNDIKIYEQAYITNFIIGASYKMTTIDIRNVNRVVIRATNVSK